ncbi:unnamed protein product [[Candida] boidinii]|nr:unnamed protein product [[Candida] boidinii]
MVDPMDARRSNDSFAYSTDGSLITDTSSLDSEAIERAQQENESRSIRVEEYRRHEILSPIDSVNSRNSIINRVKSTTSSFGDIAVRVNTLTKTVSQSVAAILEQARDDDIQTNKEKEDLMHTKAEKEVQGRQLFTQMSFKLCLMYFVKIQMTLHQRMILKGVSIPPTLWEKGQ